MSNSHIFEHIIQILFLIILLTAKSRATESISTLSSLLKEGILYKDSETKLTVKGAKQTPPNTPLALKEVSKKNTTFSLWVT